MKVVYHKTIEFKESVPPIVLEITRQKRGIDVLASIYLPADSLGELHPFLRRSDIAVNWEFLDANWGIPCNVEERPYRYVRHVVSRSSMGEAMCYATEWLYITLLPLLIDLAKRSPLVARGIYRATNPQAIWTSI